MAVGGMPPNVVYDVRMIRKHRQQLRRELAFGNERSTAYPCQNGKTYCFENRFKSSRISISLHFPIPHICPEKVTFHRDRGLIYAGGIRILRNSIPLPNIAPWGLHAILEARQPTPARFCDTFDITNTQ